MTTTEADLTDEQYEVEVTENRRERIRTSGSVFERLLAILDELPAIGKVQRNDQQNFMYRGHDDVLNALNPLLAKYGVFCAPEVLDRVTDERKTTGGKTMYEVNLLVQYTFYGAGGDSFVASAWGEGTDMGDKSTNKAMTMAFKNVLAQVFAVSTAENVDTDGLSPEETTRPGTEQAQEPREFDPGRDVLEGAIHGEGYVTRLAEAMANIDPTIDWAATLAPCISTVFGVESRQEIPTERQAEFWRRLSNAVEKINLDGGDGDTPAPDNVIVAALAWAFKGAVAKIEVEGATTEEERQAAEEAIAAAEAAE